MFFVVQRYVGYACIALGVLLSFSGNLTYLLLSLAGFVLVSLGSIAESAQWLYVHQSGMPLKMNQVQMLISRAPKFSLYSNSLTLQSARGFGAGEYSIVRLNNENYIRVRPFVQYVKQDGREYTFSFPGMKPFTKECAFAYHAGVELFGYQDQAYIRIDSLGLDFHLKGDQAYFEVKESDGLTS
ncbi:hypothetical protein [Paenibacillus protaetiae]|uniref:Uncharacterized protein n=1 Tax=Paenibacillus protaetiae TaxID=2509456 RepID=A0A4P6EVP1_9BACL|nr:hypothetical protein [Paenibacillus protaetiae]QAY66726.1 hypothetical protein ET464_10215 [Paenibacillus protaetiae]